MKFPYGICDFRKIVTKGYYYCDRTDRIPKLEKHEYALFLRPRRFGKSLLLSMLANYYDIARKDQFDEIFGKLKIGKNPTSLRNQFLVLEWDFSCIWHRFFSKEHGEEFFVQLFVNFLKEADSCLI